MKYVEVTFRMDETGVMRDLLVDELGNQGPYESFVETSDGLKAYVRMGDYDAHYLEVVASSFPVPLHYEVAEMEDRDWNAEWERGHEAVLVRYEGGSVWVRAPFHPHRDDVDYEVIIEPKMSFGTAHHPTTYMMLSYVAERPMLGKRVLDMGCGTAVLGILAKKRGAAYVEGVDIDEWAFANARENAAVNGTDIVFRLGGAEGVNGLFDVVLANINRNILLADMGKYVAGLSVGGKLVMSGFYEADVAAIVDKGTALGMRMVSSKVREGWAAVELEKQAD